MNLIITLFLLFLAVLLIYFAFRLNLKKKQEIKRKAAQKKKQNISADGVIPGCCPLCRTPLNPPMRVHSIVYEGGKSDGRLCRITGCPYCEPKDGSKGEASENRVCPVCKKKVPVKGYLTSRMFEREKNKHHVHILGCSECHKK